MTYLLVLGAGLLISFLLTRTEFSSSTAGLLAFVLVVIPAIVYPDFGLVVIIVSMLFSPDITLGFSGVREISLRIEDLFLMAVLLAWLVRTAIHKDIGRIFHTRLTLPMFLFLLSVAASTFLASVADSRFNLRHGLLAVMKYAEYFLIFFMVRYNLRSVGQTRFFVSIFLLVALLVALHSNFAIQQNISMGKQIFRIAPPVDSRGGHESGTLGGYLLFMIGIAGALCLSLRSAVKKTLLVFLLIFMLRGFLYTLSRGSYLGLIPTVLTLVFYFRRPILVFSLALLVPVFFLFLPHMIKERIQSTVEEKESLEGEYLVLDASAQARVDTWKVILFEKFPQRPVLGHGVGRHFIDGQLFLTLVESGLFGLFFLGWVLIRLFKMARDALGAEGVQEDEFGRGLCVGFLAGFIGLLFNSLSANVFIIIRIMEPFWFMAAIVLSLPHLFGQEKSKNPQPYVVEST